MYKYTKDKTYHLDGLGPTRFKTGEIVPEEVLKVIDSDTLRKCCEEIPSEPKEEAKVPEPEKIIVPEPEPEPVVEAEKPKEEAKVPNLKPKTAKKTTNPKGKKK